MKKATNTADPVAAAWEPADAVRPDPQNHRRHPPDQVRRIAASLARYGWGRPLLARLDGTLLAGHGTLLAARWLVERAPDGTEDDRRLAEAYAARGHGASVLVRRLDLDATRARELGLLDNALPDFAEDVPEAVESVLASADQEMRAILAAVTEAEDVEIAGEWAEDYAASVDQEYAGRFVVVVRGPIRSQPEALLVLRDHLAEVEDVDVEVTWS